MDTKYWGPGGWILLHSISFAPNQDRKRLIAFFSTLPYVLPCKYCRASLSEYMKRYPLEDVGNEPHAFGKWLWNIHNCVNAKLRGQRLRVMPDPPFSEVKAHYLEKAQSPCTKTTFHGWEFLFSIIENHPYSKQSRIGKPIQGAPETDKGLDSLEKNRWNMLSSDERLPFVLEFWKTLPDVLPFPEWKKIWHLCPTDWSNRVSALKTLWSIRCRSERELELLNSTTFHSLCKELRAHRSGCSASKRAKTCRKKRIK